MSTTSMFFDIFGRDKGVGELFDKVSGHGKSTTNVLQGLGAAAAGMGIVREGEKAVDTFKEVASSTLLLQREMGASSEDASRLGFALTQSGMNAEGTSKAFGIFSKNLVASEKDAASHKKMVEELGFEYMDAHGKLLPMTEILPELATRFQNMENGPEKTALALKLFGKSGADMVPFLNKGGEAITELMHKSDELGTTLSQDSVNSFRASLAEGREWDQTMVGLQATIGGALLPVLVGFEGFVHNTLAPGISGLIGWFKSLSPEMQHWVTILGGALIVGGPLILMIGKFAAAFQSIIGVVKSVQAAMVGLNAVLAANPFVLIILGIAALVAGLIWAYNNVGWFKDFVDAAFKIIQQVVGNVINWITGTLVPAFVAGWNVAGAIITWLYTNIVQPYFALIFAVISNIVQWIQGSFVPGVQGAFAIIGTVVSGAVNFFVDFYNNVTGWVGRAIDFIGSIPSRIQGFFADAGGWLLNIGSQIIGGLISGIQNALGGLGDVLGNVGKFIADHKGPESYDKQLLTPHGGWIMGSLIRGITGQLPTLQGVLGDVTDTIANGIGGGNGAGFGRGGSFPGTVVLQVGDREFEAYLQDTTIGAVARGLGGRRR